MFINSKFVKIMVVCYMFCDNKFVKIMVVCYMFCDNKFDIKILFFIMDF